MHYGQILQSTRCTSSTCRRPTCCSASTPPVQQRNIVGVAAAYPGGGAPGMLLRKFGQEVIRITAGKAGSWHRRCSGRRQ